MELTPMSSSINGFRIQKSDAAGTRRSLSLRHVSSLLAVASVMALTPAFAEEPNKPTARQIRKGVAVRVQAHDEAVMIPECLEQLKLSAEQQDQIKTIIHNYDGSVGMVWKRFGERYMQAIKMECLLLAAIEDNLTEPQRQQVRDQRRRTAQHEKAVAATDTKVNQGAETTKEETGKPASVGDEGLAASGVTLTDEQEAAADAVQEKYRSQLRSLNRDIEGLHTRLVSLEADKLVEIEKVLTKEQLAELKATRAKAPVVAKVATSKVGPTKSE